MKIVLGINHAEYQMKYYIIEFDFFIYFALWISLI